MKVGIPDVPEWLPLERYGIGIPFVLVGAGIWLVMYAAKGIGKMGTLTGYGKIGIAVVLAVSVLLIASAGYTYSQIDTGWWLLTEEEDGPSSGDADGE